MLQIAIGNTTALSASLVGAGGPFFAVPLLLPVLLWKRGATHRYVAVSAALCASTCLVPAVIVAEAPVARLATAVLRQKRRLL